MNPYLYGEIGGIEGWKWILGYSRKYNKAILFYFVFGIFGTVFGLASAMAGIERG